MRRVKGFLAEAWRQFGIPKIGEHPPLETVTRGRVLTQQTEKTKSALQRTVGFVDP
jgi:hypothetical protein